MTAQQPGRSRQVFVGAVVTPVTTLELKTIKNGLLGVDDDGIIAFVDDLDDILRNAQGDEGTSTPIARAVGGLSATRAGALHAALLAHGWSLDNCDVTVLNYGEFLCPGFIDTHTHACQVPNMGVGQEYELLDWLNRVTFPRERRFEDPKYAERTYNSVVQRLIDSGTTTACYFATLHLEASKILARVCSERGQRAFVGKCNMNRNSPDDYREQSVASSIQDTESFMTYCQALHDENDVASKSTRCESLSVPVSASRPHSLSVSSSESSFSALTDSSDSLAVSPATSFSSASPLEEKMQVTQIPYNPPRAARHKDDEEDAELMQQSLDRLSGTVDELVQTSQLATHSSSGGTTKPSEHRGSPVQSLDASGALVQPILTPRFAISCTDELLSELSKIYTREPGLRLQTHLSESTGEIEFTKELFPFAENYTRVYDHFDLLTDRTVLAHCVHLSKDELTLIKTRGSGVSHCPTSNLNLRSGVTKVGEMLNAGVKVGLGTDVSGGFGVSMLSAVREASVVAKVLNFTQKEIEMVRRESIGSQCGIHDHDLVPATPTDATAKPKQHDFTTKPLTIPTLFYLATLGGAHVASVADRVGSLQVGKEFDALRVSLCASEDEEQRASLSAAPATSPTSPCDDGLLNAYIGNPNVFVHTQEEYREEEPLEAMVEKFLFTADDRNIHSVWVKGRIVGGTQLKRARYSSQRLNRVE